MKLQYTLPARQRLTKIEDYLTVHASEQTAAKVVDGLLKKALSLVDPPRKGRPVRHLAHRGKGHRGLSASRYLVVYLLEGETIFITDFFDTKQHPSRMRG
jgi:plasmid stabilization system protein ParE